MNLLIPYISIFNHKDPDFDEFTYGDSGSRGKKLKKLKKSDVLFFHTSIGGKKYITAYIVVESVINTPEAAADKYISDKYKNPHLKEYLDKGEEFRDDCVVFGDIIRSKKLSRHLLFDFALAKKLSLGIEFQKGRTQAQVIGSATRAWRELTNKDVEVLRSAIKKSESSALKRDIILTTDEVAEIIEKDLEDFIEHKSHLITKSLKLIGRQLDTKVGRIDLLFENESKELVLVELKIDKIGRQAINQIHRYMSYMKETSGKKVLGVLVCKDVMPAFRKDFAKIKDIKILKYGWKLEVVPWESNI